MKTSFAVITLSLAIISQAFSKAYFQTETELVTKATAIAIVELDEPKASEQKGAAWTYRQMATAKVIQRLKGDLPDKFTIHGDETFICAQCHLSGGFYLAFLIRDGDLWVGANWNLSLRPVKGDQIEWYLYPDQSHPMKFQSSESVLRRVRAILAGVGKNS